MVDTENSKKIKSSLDKFLSWLHNYGFESNDKDDLLDSDFGLFTKRLFYKNKFLGAPFAITLLIGETFFPQIIKHLSSKRREAIADAHYALGYLNLYSTLGDKDFTLAPANTLSSGYLILVENQSALFNPDVDILTQGGDTINAADGTAVAVGERRAAAWT